MDDKLKMVVETMGDFLEALKQPVAIIDKEGKYVYYNKYDAEIDHTPVKDALGNHLLNSYTNLTEETSTMLRAVKYGEKFIDQHQIYHTRSGKIVDYIHTTLPIYNGANIIGAIEIGRDIGNIKELTNQVLDLSAKLYAHDPEQKEMGNEDCGIITHNITMKKILQELDIYARSNYPLLIYGETGTGKELFVKRAHRKSPRADNAFISFNCAAIPDTLLESILFGTTKGAFTGAENRKGFFEIADGGTLFLDELNSMPIEIQAKLLRAIQEGQIMKLGTTKPINIDVRVIAAMNEKPEEAVANGHLRPDLFYRLSVGMISIPPLRHRKDDIPLLADYFIKKFSSELNRKIRLVNPRIIREMEQHDWPGNVRMLENVIRRSIMLEAPDNIALNELHFIFPDHSQIEETRVDQQPESAGLMEEPLSLADLVDAFEKDLLVKALNTSRGNIKQASHLLQIPRTTLQYKVKKFNLNYLCNN
ncbi:MAG: sigma 54-interacting transcriptional regulator [Syntrophomonadaceae bacterium]|nr:sigma 54-interacting transcriptional regulator [Syntrophomonadaceae bacterium]MDD4549024.1 sigma 54-interacting transcriptional regulator [Syntrophomonadaceae bacterium]